jgi:signal transduction histidine kinase
MTRLPDDACLEPMLHHVAGVALAQLGRPEAATEQLETAVAAARESDLRFELVLALDALEQLADHGGDGSPERRQERDALLARMDIVRLPAPPVTPLAAGSRRAG